MYIVYLGGGGGVASSSIFRPNLCLNLSHVSTHRSLPVVITSHASEKIFVHNYTLTRAKEVIYLCDKILKNFYFRTKLYICIFSTSEDLLSFSIYG
jgi:hypothetical protein